MFCLNFWNPYKHFLSKSLSLTTLLLFLGLLPIYRWKTFKLDFDAGVTFEFYLQKTAFHSNSDKEVVILEDNRHMACSFHPEIDGDTRVHEYFLGKYYYGKE